MNRLVATATLEKAGYRVEVATNGLEALAAVRDHDFQLVLMDVQMPEMDGIEASRRIRDREFRLEHDDRLPIIALTAHALDEERDRCLDAGMDDFLAKPFRAEDLLTVLERWTRGRQGGDDPMGISDTAAPEPCLDLDDAPPLDLEAFRAVLEAAGIPEVYETTLTVFREDLPRRRAEIQAAWEAGDVAAVADAAHAIKSAAGNVRADRLNALVADLETAGRQADRDRMDELWPDVAGELERVDCFLQSR